jgi:CheY-like chemotaxis protein
MNNPQAKPIEILLVEDSPGDVLIAREALSEAKLLNDIHVAEDGVEAMDFLHKRGKFAAAPTPDLILLDLNLPRKSGREVLAEIKTDENLKFIPVIILTTSSAEEDILKSYNLYANCYVVKPVEFESFVQAVKSIENFWFSVVTLPSAKE